MKVSSTGETTDRLWSVHSKNFLSSSETTTFTTRRESQAGAPQTSRISAWQLDPVSFGQTRDPTADKQIGVRLLCDASRKATGFSRPAKRGYGRFACCALSSPAIAPLAMVLRTRHRALLCVRRYRTRAWLLHKTHRHTHSDLLEQDITGQKCTRVTYRRDRPSPVLYPPSLSDDDRIAH